MVTNLGCTYLYFIIYEYHVVGDLAFELGMDKATCKESCGKFKIKVKRYDGSKGTITCKYETRSSSGDSSQAMAAIAGTDYSETRGELMFGPGQCEKIITIPIIDNKTPGAKHCAFEIELFDVKGPVERVGFKEGAPTKCNVSIIADEATANIIALAQQHAGEAKMKYEDDPLTIRDQIKQAFEVEVEDGEDITNSVLAIHYVGIHFS